MPAMVKYVLLLCPLFDHWAQPFLSAETPRSRIASPYHRHSFVNRNVGYRENGQPVFHRRQGRQGRKSSEEEETEESKNDYIKRLKERIVERASRKRSEGGQRARMSEVEYKRKVEQMKGLRRVDDFEEQVERSVPWDGDSWRNRVKEYLEKRRGSKEGGFKVESREDPGSGDRLLAEIVDEKLDLADKKEAIPSTFLSPPVGDILVGDNTWKDAFDTELETSSISTSTGKVEITTSEVTTADLFENLTDTTIEILNDLDEVRELSVKAKTTLEKLQEFKNATQATKCQSAADCKSNQVCYLPTNECKDQLTFSLRERSSCTNSTDCNSNEVCYLSTKKCVCDLGYFEQSGSCVSLKSLNCTETTSTKVTDSNLWGVQPYCFAWGNSTVFGDTNGKLSFGTYMTGTGIGDDPMMFIDGSKENCDNPRTAKLYYDCYCDEEEYDCTTEPAWNQTGLFWGEFNPCVYSAYVFTPLACPSKVG